MTKFGSITLSLRLCEQKVPPSRHVPYFLPLWRAAGRDGATRRAHPSQGHGSSPAALNQMPRCVADSRDSIVPGQFSFSPDFDAEVHNILVRFQTSGNVETRQGENALGPPNMVMTYGRVATLLESMLANEAAGDGDEMLQEIYADFLEREGVVVDIATLCRTIRDHGFSRNRAYLARSKSWLTRARPWACPPPLLPPQLAPRVLPPAAVVSTGAAPRCLVCRPLPAAHEPHVPHGAHPVDRRVARRQPQSPPVRGHRIPAPAARTVNESVIASACSPTRPTIAGTTATRCAGCRQ